MARIAIIGGGIIGSATACWLLSDGHEVTLYERDIGGLPASSGNAALLAVREIEPLASAETLLSLPRWMADPNGPLSLRPQDLPALIPWLLAFWASARPSQTRARRIAMAGLMRNVLADHEELGRRAGLAGHIRHTGALMIYDYPAGIEAELKTAAHVKELLDLDTEQLSADEARKLAPALEGEFAGAIHAPEYRMVTDPLTMLRHLQSVVRDRGTIRATTADRIDRHGDTPRIVDETGDVTDYDTVVVAAGIWSRGLVRRLGLRILLETERGYNTTFPAADIDLPLPVFLGDHGFVASPLEGALRIGGAVELASPEAPPSPTRAKKMLEKMRRYVPALPREGGIEWMGRRPSTPDSLPVIGPHPDDPHILFAFGHGHLGLTLSARTAHLIADLIRNGAPDPSLEPFSIGRFQR